MKEEYKKEGTIRGTRYFTELTKTVKNVPGFAPEEFEVEAGAVVRNFPHGDDSPYYQCLETPPIFDVEDIKQIEKLLTEDFDETKYNFEDK